MLNNSLVADSWVSKSVCNLTLTTSTVETTLSSSSGQPRTPWEWINKYKQRMFFKLLCIWSTGHFSSSETKARFQTMTSSSLHLLPFLMIPVHSTALFLSIGKRFFIMCCHFQRISQYAIGYFIFECLFCSLGQPSPAISWLFLGLFLAGGGCRPLPCLGGDTSRQGLFCASWLGCLTALWTCLIY